MFSHPIFNATLCATQEMLPATPENLAHAFADNHDNAAYWGVAREVRNALGETIETPGLVVLEIEEMMLDLELNIFLPETLYLLVTANATLEVSSSLGKNFRLGNPVAIVDADIIVGVGLDGAPVDSMSIEPLYALRDFGAIENAEGVIADLAETFMEVADIMTEVNSN